MTLSTRITPTLIAPGLTLRPARWTDAPSVADLTRAVCTAEGDATFAQSAVDIEGFWKTPGFTLETDAWVVETADARIVGYEEFDVRHAHAYYVGDGYVHPNFVGRGIGTAMLRQLEARARREMVLADPDLRVFLRNGMPAKDAAARALHEGEGYQLLRYNWRMEITVDAEPVPAWPAGIQLRPFDRDRQDRLVFEADDEAFQDHFGHVPGSFARWQHHVSGREDFDASLWHIAWEGDQIAGFSLCRYRAGIGWVNSLGVRRPWRKRGLGLALLQHSFAEFWRRGTTVVGLGVDAANPTGATRLYQKVGMHVASEIVAYEKELRPGRDVTEEH